MAESAAKADGGILLTAVVARRRKDGKLVVVEPTIRAGGQMVTTEHELGENSDRALDLYAFLKKSKGAGGKYTSVALFLRSRTSRKVSFT